MERVGRNVLGALIAATLFILIPLLLIQLPGTSAYADQSTYFSCDNCSDCQEAIGNLTYNETRLSQDINTSDTCIVLNISGSSFQCVNRNIFNLTSSEVYGINVTASNVTIMGCALSNLTIGIYSTTDQTTISNVSTHDVVGQGMYLLGDYAIISSSNFQNSNEGLVISGAHSIVQYSAFDDFPDDDALILASGSSNATIRHNSFTQGGTEAAILVGTQLLQHKIINNTVNDYEYCIWDAGTGTEITNNSLDNCNNRGITLVDSGGHVLGNTITNSGTGILLNSTSALAEYNNITSSAYGIAVYDDGNTIHHNSVTGGVVGVGLYTSMNHVYENVLDTNTWGVYLSDAQLNNVTNNTVLASATSSIYLFSASYNMIWNNLFNSTLNVIVANSGTNYWNTSLANGTNTTNILGGSWIGGNAFVTPGGSGQSMTCIDTDRDGICDAPYPITADNVDYLVLNARLSSPNVTGQNPVDGYGNDSYPPQEIEFTCDVAEQNGYLASVELWLTTPANSFLALNSSHAVNGSINSSSWNISLGYGNYSWNCRAVDTGGNGVWGENRSLLMNYSDQEVPFVNQSTPEDSYVNGSSYWTTLSFACYGQDNFRLSSIGVWITNSSNESYYELGGNSYSPILNTTQLVVAELEAGNYSWACRAEDYAGNVNWTSNRSIILNATRPYVQNTNTSENFTSIQAAIDDPDTLAGHTVTIPSGRWKENINIDKSLFIHGAGSALTSIEPTNSNDYAVEITASDVLLYGVNITGVTNPVYAALFLESVSDVNLTTLELSENTNGIFLSNVSDTRIINVDVKSTQKNIILQESRYLTLSSLTLTSGTYGVDMDFVNNSALSDIAITGSNTYGLDIANSYANSLYQITTTDTANRFQDSDQNTLRRLQITGSPGVGLYLASADNNTIYDNYFNNTNNTRDDGNNTWNANLVTGTNILAGSKLGGNFFANPNGTGCSELSAIEDTDGDRVADVGNCSILGGNNTDLKPLTYNYDPPEEEDDDDNSTGGGSTYVPFTYTQKGVQAKREFFGLAEGTRRIWDITDSAMLVRRFTFTAGKDIWRSDFVVSEFSPSDKPSSAPSTTLTPTKYIEIAHSGLQDKDLKEVEIEIKMSSDQSLYLYDKSWAELPVTKRTGNYATVASPHASWFVIAKKGSVSGGTGDSSGSDTGSDSSSGSGSGDSGSGSTSGGGTTPPTTETPGVIDTPFEPPEPEGSPIDWFTIAIIVLAVVGITGGAVYWYWGRQVEPEGPSVRDILNHSVSPGTSVQIPDEVVNFVEEKLEKQYPIIEIERALESHGWAPATVIAAEQRAGAEMARRNSDDPLVQLHAFVENARRKGVSDSVTRQKLESVGWRQDVLENAFLLPGKNPFNQK